MAAVTLGVATTSTANQSAYSSASFTPAAGDLLIVYAAASGESLAAPTATELSGTNGLTFTFVGKIQKPVAEDTIYAFVADQLVPGSPAAMNARVDFGADLATGCVVSVMRVSGMTLTGLSAIRQTATDSGALSTTPTLVFPASCLTGNPTIVGHLDTSATGTTPPASWTELYDVTYGSPTIGASGVSRDSGFTGTTITWGGTATQHAEFAVELDTSTGSTITGTGSVVNAADTVAGTSSEVIAGTGAVANAGDVVAGTGTEVIAGTGAVTDANDTVSGSGAEVFTGSGAVANVADSVAGSGLEVIVGTGSVADANDAVSGSGTVSSPAITGSGAVVNADDSAAGVGNVGTVNWFRTPTTRRKAGDRRLYDLYTLNKGISVVKVDGHYRRYPIPPHTILLPLVAGRDYFIGGTAAVVVTSEVAAALTADGFTVYDHNPDED